MQPSAQRAPFDDRAGDAEAAVAKADFLPLALALVQATGNADLLRRLTSARQAITRQAGVAADLEAEVRTGAIGLLRRDAASRAREEPVDPSLFAALVELISDRTEGTVYSAMLWEQAGFEAARRSSAGASAQRSGGGGPTVAVIGAGMSGICAAIELKAAGFDFRVFERGDSVAGTWADNVYPGCGVDTPSVFYSYSFEPSDRWAHHFAKRDAIADYFERCVDKYGVRDRIQLRTEVVDCSWDEGARRWVLRIRPSDGVEITVVADVVITAVGQLNIPAVPRFEGADCFAGRIVHTARWPADLDVCGKRVGLVGTGASGMQVGPTIAPQVERLTVFQREPHWVLPNAQYHEPIGPEQKWLMHHMPHYAQWVRAQLIWSYGDAVYPALTIDPAWNGDGASINATSEKFRQFMLRHLRSELEGRPDLIAKATPDYPPYSKRVLLDNHWYRLLRRENVELVTQPIARLVKDGVVTADGTVHRLDLLVLATGFQATRMLASVDIKGRSGRPLRQVWQDDNPRAYLGITVPGFPNMFMLYGPNTNLGYGGSAIFNTECQVHYIVRCLQEMRARDWATLECRPDAHDAYNETVDRMHAAMVWARQDVDNWYRNAAGRVTTNSPWRLVDYWAMTREPDMAHFIAERAARAEAA
jgi:4-hydroxyacetophenone monooxygenase